MSRLGFSDKDFLEGKFCMAGGYFLNFSNRNLEDFFETTLGLNVYSEDYLKNVMPSESKANIVRHFWKTASDDQVAKFLSEARPLLTLSPEEHERYGAIIHRLAQTNRGVANLRIGLEISDLPHLEEQIRRIENAVDKDPASAIGTAKDLVETCCKTILQDHNVAFDAEWNLTKLVKETSKVLKLLPKQMPQEINGSETIRALLTTLSQITQRTAELRNLYGTGHGKHGASRGLQPRHARLAVGASMTLVRFLFDTHSCRKTESD
jgi:hypothetical protein